MTPSEIIIYSDYCWYDSLPGIISLEELNCERLQQTVIRSMNRLVRRGNDTPYWSYMERLVARILLVCNQCGEIIPLSGHRWLLAQVL